MVESEKIIALFAAAEDLNQKAQEAFKEGKTEELQTFVKEAITIYKEILELEPNNSKALYFLGNKFYESEDYDSSLNSYDKALEMLEKDDELIIDVQINRTGTLCELKRYDEAIAGCEGILTEYKTHPDFADIERACTWIKNNCNERKNIN